MSIRTAPTLALFVLGSMLAAASLAHGAPPDWNAVAETREIQVLTTDEDGDTRETTIWLAVLDGQGFIRTSSSTTWGGNVSRDPDIALRIDGVDYEVRAEFVEDEALRERIVSTFREKYGWVDGFMNIFRGSRALIMRLDPRG